MKFIVIAFTLFLAACGGGDSEPIAQCNGAPNKAVIYLGDYFPELASIPNACVYTTDARTVDELAQVVAIAKANAGTLRVYFISSAGALVLDFMAAHPGNVDVASLWFVPDGHGAGIVWSLATVNLNGGACEATAARLRAQFTAAFCVSQPQAFGAAERAQAIGQLSLP